MELPKKLLLTAAFMTAYFVTPRPERADAAPLAATAALAGSLCALTALREKEKRRQREKKSYVPPCYQDEGTRCSLKDKKRP